MKKAEFEKLMVACGLFSRDKKEITQPLIEGHYSMLKDYGIGEITKAFLTRLKENGFFPVPADIIAEIKGSESGTKQIIASEREWEREKEREGKERMPEVRHNLSPGQNMKEARFYRMIKDVNQRGHILPEERKECEAVLKGEEKENVKFMF